MPVPVSMGARLKKALGERAILPEPQSGHKSTTIASTVLPFAMGRLNNPAMNGINSLILTVN